MKNIKKLFLVTLFAFYFEATFSQTTDSLSVFPNPFSNSAMIRFDIDQSDTITLRVFNITGQTVKTFFQSAILPSGSYNVNLLGDSLVEGIYLIRLDIGTAKNITRRAIKSGLSSSIADIKTVDKVLIYPNPTNDRITIPFAGNKTIILTDLNGKTLKSFMTDKQEISLLDMAAGQYILTILTSKSEILTIQKILKSE